MSGRVTLSVRCLGGKEMVIAKAYRLFYTRAWDLNHRSCPSGREVCNQLIGSSA